MFDARLKAALLSLARQGGDSLVLRVKMWCSKGVSCYVLIVAVVLTSARGRADEKSESAAQPVRLKARHLKDYFPHRFALHSPLIQRELHITVEQREVLTEIKKKWLTQTERLRGPQSQLHRLPQTKETRESLKKLRSLMIEVNKWADAESYAALSGEQQGRLREISIQLSGVEAFLDPEFRDQLALSTVQERELVAVFVSLSKDSAELLASHQAGRMNSSKYGRVVHKRKEDAKEVIIAGLTEAQCRQFSAMQGERVTFSRSDLAVRIKPRSIPQDEGRLQPIPDPLIVRPGEGGKSVIPQK